MKQKAHALLRQMLQDEHAEFRPGQWEAVAHIVSNKGQALVVQRTGWGKSIVYFLATKILRDEGAGPTLLVSPLLSLMRNQIEMAKRIGLTAHTINSTNRDKWVETHQALEKGCCDILLISPERLNNTQFLEHVLPTIAGQIGLLVVDEAHCISDWGHDFRPDYRRIPRILRLLPKGVPVLCTTATANDRVIQDIQEQIGELSILRGPLVRTSLRLQNIVMGDQASRLAWLAYNIPKLPRSGVIYCLTVADCERVSRWLLSQGINAPAYHAGSDGRIDRPSLEKALIRNEVKALVATVALGMGFDKPDLGFVVHFQRPGSVIFYYQQVGRAGRAIDKSYGILLSGTEDDDIQNYFIESAFPSQQTLETIVRTLEQTGPIKLQELLSYVNVRQSVAEKALKLLELDGAIGVEYNRGIFYFRTPNPWQPDYERYQRVTDLRRQELSQMHDYVSHSGCLMEFLCSTLDDLDPKPCGRCANCVGRGFSAEVPLELIVAAVEFLKSDELKLLPRERLPGGIHAEKGTLFINQEGRSLCDYGDAGWGTLVRKGKYIDNHFADDLVKAAYNLIKHRWCPEPFPQWITSIPSLRRPKLVPDFAQRLGRMLELPYHQVLIRTKQASEQKGMENSYMQAQNVQGTLGMMGSVPHTPVLLVDDIVDSRWTLTIAGSLLQQHGSGLVYPFTLARAQGK